MARSVNLVIVLGNLTRDPQMRYTPKGTAVANFSVATNRTWISEGREQEQVDYHNVVVWNKLAETCNNLLSKGRKVYVRGRLSSRSWEDNAGQKHYRTEIVAEEVIFLDAFKEKAAAAAEKDTEPAAPGAEEKNGESKGEPEKSAEAVEEVVDEEDLPF